MYIIFNFETFYDINYFMKIKHNIGTALINTGFIIIPIKLFIEIKETV